jgi:hypothetical protein
VGGLGPKGGSGRLGGFTGLKTMNRGGGGDAGARTAPGLSQGSTRPPWPRGGAGSLLRHAPLRAWHLHLPLITQESTGAPPGRSDSTSDCVSGPIFYLKPVMAWLAASALPACGVARRWCREK